MNRRRPLIISDYAGQAFTAELASALRNRGERNVIYSYCETVTSPKGRLREDDGTIAVRAGRTFEKYDLRGRLASEVRYGFNLARVVLGRRPHTHVVCNMPLVTLAVAWLAGVPVRTRLVIWFQDAQAGLVYGMLGQGVVPRLLAALEGFLLRRARAVIAISDELAHEALRQGARRDRVTTVENWAPIEEIPVLPRETAWAREHNLGDGPILLYSGTLGRKHRFDLLLDLARTVAAVDGTVVVVSEGEGAVGLSEQKARTNDLGNLVLLPYQPFERLPEVLASADVLIALLEPAAGKFSVPSKVLSYLCAARPILASIPLSNTAARIVTERAHAGVVIDPGKRHDFCLAALQLLNDPVQRERLGQSGRAYAESHFRQEVVISRFLSAIAFDDQARHVDASS